ncbi:hypothetical protein [Phaeodactylibacter luteus]|uniref:Cohesin domain-containing protein n=1 Tax=Phaeodactylibacter luteus TaxID=1564516 RepID=A0A5C6RHT4_9BACT|nr:hypothetical protein [Phaeodactylibacter luteus]TXB61901.1 hypothetical protein FRY97_16765 [Phaeodactylibacter luteus]
MQKLFLRLTGAAFVLSLLIATGCTEDEPMDPTNTPPSVSLLSGTDLVTSDVTLEPGESFMVSIDLKPGSTPLETFTFLVDGVVVGNADIINYYGEYAINGSTETANNPVTFFGAAKDGAVMDISITPFDIADGSFATFSFQIEDEAGEVSVTSIDVSVVDPTTPLDMTLTGVLFNQAGPTGTGGLNLDNGEGTGSADAEAEIRDLGLDCTVPAPGLNWRRQIGTVNGADMVAVDLTQVENFTFDNVTNKEQIIGAYDTGIALSDGVSVNCATSNETAVTDVSDELTVGDLFVVLSNGTYYLIRIDAIDETDSNNNDSYELSIKY